MRTGNVTAETETAFARLADRWARETRFISSIEKMVLHPAYQQIIGMGEKAIPLLLRELQERPNQWFWALRSITGADPVPEAAQGDFDLMVEAWLDWGRKNGYL